ncbi:hypothetical protein ACMYYO_11490 [Dermacoccaceae bacterium W4C1]
MATRPDSMFTTARREWMLSMMHVLLGVPMLIVGLISLTTGDTEVAPWQLALGSALLWTAWRAARRARAMAASERAAAAGALGEPPTQPVTPS